LTRDGPKDGDDLYAISVNCWVNEHNDPKDLGSGCKDGKERLLFSPGGNIQTTERTHRCEVGDADDTFWMDGEERYGFEHNCDVVEGSSGAPIFDAKWCCLGNCVRHQLVVWRHRSRRISLEVCKGT